MYIFFSQYDFEGRKDLVKFIKAVQNEGLYVILRVGPYIGGEWNFGCGDLLDFLLLSLVLFISLFIFLAVLLRMILLLSYRGFPVWLRFIPGIELRTDNDAFKVCTFMVSEIGDFFLCANCYFVNGVNQNVMKAHFK